ncbi:dihydropteroate synthase [Chryseobacterium sp. A301]
MTKIQSCPSQSSFSLNCHGRLISLETPKLMGILNVTPDSFSDSGKFQTQKAALAQAELLVSQGADILDLGPQSTRPGATFLSAAQEIERLGTLISILKKEYPEVLISVDSFWSDTLRYSFDQGMDIANDISAGQYDSTLFETVADLQVPYILMHVNPTYESMHEKHPDPQITTTVNQFLLNKARLLTQMGVKDLILDPGFGFGKTQDDQERLIGEVGILGFGNYPLLIGISRKSFIYKPLNKMPLDLEVDEKTQELHLRVLRQGAKILRVHDVGSAKKTLSAFLTEQNSQKP